MKAQTTVLFDAPGPRARRNILISNAVALVSSGRRGAVLIQLNTRTSWPRQVINALNGHAWATTTCRAAVHAAVSGIAVVTAMVFGLFFGFLRLAPFAPIRWFAGVLVDSSARSGAGDDVLPVLLLLPHRRPLRADRLLGRRLLRRDRGSPSTTVR